MASNKCPKCGHQGGRYYCEKCFGCKPCFGRGKRLYNPELDPPGVHVNGPFKCPQCDGTGGKKP